MGFAIALPVIIRSIKNEKEEKP